MAARFALRGVRARTTLAATVVVAVVLGVASLLFTLLQRHELRNSLAEVARQQAEDVATQVADGVSTSQIASLNGGEEALVQIVDSSGKVVASSPSIEGEPPLTSGRPAPGSTITTFVERLAVAESDPYVVVARGATSPDGDVIVVTAQSLEVVQESTGVIVRLLLLGFPLVLIAVAGTSYWLTGRALAPVRDMRLRVAEISRADSDAQVPVSAAGDEISLLAETMNAMLARLRTSAQTQRRFVADASHELRSPLTTIRAAHEIALAHQDTTDWLATSKDTLAETDRLDRLVSDLLLLARIDERGIGLRLADVDLDDLMSHEADRLRRTTGLAVDAQLSPARIQGDSHHLERMLRNLTDNAARHAASTVSLRLSVSQGDAILSVEDDGPGIPVTDREIVFGRFIRLDESRHRGGGGTGLGLSIAAEIAHAHQGSIRVADSISGTVFVVELPIVDSLQNRKSPCRHTKYGPFGEQGVRWLAG
jgi:signal transduction histidine kinase